MLFNTAENKKHQANGRKEEVKGWIQEKVGKLTHNRERELEGHLRQIKGETMQEHAKADERTKGAIEEVTGAIKHGCGHLLGNKQMQLEGAIKEKTGQARQKLNK
jgi:uncharacterized protein YjbJ (UPF0337 family)